MEALLPGWMSVVVTGDIARTVPDAYRRVELTEDGRSSATLAGNHDDPDATSGAGAPGPLEMVRIGEHWTMAS
jgi:hypothetical protein